MKLQDLTNEQFKEEFIDLCQLQCGLEEIRLFFHCEQKDLCKRCKEVFGKSSREAMSEQRIGGLVKLRRSQFKLAEKNAAMAIWLGKNYLGQSDSPQSVEIIEKKEEDPITKSLKEMAEKL